MRIQNFSLIQINTIKIILFISVIKILTFTKEVTFAAFFGIDRNTDIYFYSLIIPGIIFNIFSGSFTSFFIPSYINIKSNSGVKAAQEYAFNSVIQSSLIILLVNCLCGWIIPSILVEHNPNRFLDTSQINNFLIFSKLASIFFFLYTVSFMISALLQAEHRYAISFYPQFAVPLITIVFILWGSQKFAILSIFCGMISGAIFCLLILIILAYKFKLLSVQYPLGRALQTLPNLSQFWTLIVAALFPAAINIIDQYMAGNIAEGSLSTFNYGIRIPEGISEILGLGLGVAIFSHFSQWAAEQKQTHMITSTQRIIIYLTLIVIPICMFIHLYSQSIISFLFERGAFSFDAVKNVSKFLSAYIIATYLFVVGVIGTRLVSAINKNQIILVYGMINLIIKVTLNIIFIQYLGLQGIAFSTVGMYLIGVSFIYWALSKEGINIFTKDFLIKLIRGSICTLIIFICLVFTHSLLTTSTSSIFLKLSIGFISTLLFIFILFYLNKKLYFLI